MNNIEAKFYEEIQWLFDLTLNQETSPPWALGLKVGEETGEFQEALLKELGHLRHKELKEDVWHEAADIINTLIGCLARLNPDMSAVECTERLYDAVCTKGDKYERILND